MKFFCEYCGARIDADTDDKCPSCGASYKKNKTFIRLEEEKNKDQNADRKFKEQMFNHTMKSMKFSRIFMIFPIIIFLLVFSVIVFNILNLNVFRKEAKEENVTVNFNEYGSTSKYRVKVSKYETVESAFKDVEDDYEYVKFTLLVENISNEQIGREDVFCIVDGIAQTNYFVSGYSDLPFFINKGLTVSGTATFLVPKKAKSYQIKYGDYVTINIEKSKN